MARNIVCKYCGTAHGYFRHNTNEWVCRKCGIIDVVPYRKEVGQNGKE